MRQNGRELLEHGLGDIYDAEHRFVDGLEEMVEQVSDDSLKEAFSRHLRVTREQIRRLERAFDELDMPPKREDCPGSKGLVAEYKKFIADEDPDGPTLDTFAAESAQKVEHYEIVSYRSLVTLADFLGFKECARIFKQNLAEEEQAAADLRPLGGLLAANLTKAGGPDVARRAAGVLVDEMRDGALRTAGAAKTVGRYATRRTGDAVQTAQRKGRKAIRSAQARGRATRKKTTTSAGRARKTSTRSSSGRPRAKAAGRPGARRTSNRTSKKTPARSGRASARSRA